MSQEDQLRSILSTNPNNLEANFQLALISGKRGDLSGCVDHFTRVLQIAPANIQLKATIAINYWTFNMYDKAFDLFYSLGQPDLPGDIRNHLITMIQQKEQQKYFIRDTQTKAMELLILRVVKKVIRWTGELASDWEVNEVMFSLSHEWKERYDKIKSVWSDSSDIMSRILELSQKVNNLEKTEDVQEKIEWFETQKKLWNSKKLEPDIFYKTLLHFETFIRAKIEGSEADSTAVLLKEDFDADALAEVQRFYTHKRMLIRASDKVYANWATAFQPFILIDEMALRGFIYRGEELWCKENAKDNLRLWSKFTSIRKKERIEGFKELADCVEKIIEKAVDKNSLRVNQVLTEIKRNFEELQKKRKF